MVDKIACKACGSYETDILESRICNNGTRRRRHRCLSCGYRWTYWDGPRPVQGRIAGSRNAGLLKKRQTTEEDVRRILLSPPEVTNVTLGREISLSAEWVRRIRLGLSCVNICPELERQKGGASSVKGRSCYNCFYWTTGCYFGFPDPCIEGPGYAQDCDFFKLKDSQV